MKGVANTNEMCAVRA